MALQALRLLQDTRPGRNAAWAGIAMVSLLAWLGLEQQSAHLWLLPAGLRLALLWLVPTRRWGWLGLAEVLAQATKSLLLGYPLFSMTFVAVCIAPWVIYAMVVYVARGPQPGPALDTPTRMLAFLLAGLVGAAGVSPLLWMFLVTVPSWCCWAPWASSCCCRPTTTWRCTCCCWRSRRCSTSASATAGRARRWARWCWAG
jgi:two-component system sensor histidine kinase UhpB